MHPRDGASRHPSVRLGTRARPERALCGFRRAKLPWRCWSGCLLQALIIALLVELPLGIDDLVSLLEQPALDGEPQRDVKHKEDEHQEQGEHERLLPVERTST